MLLTDGSSRSVTVAAGRTRHGHGPTDAAELLSAALYVAASQAAAPVHVGMVGHQEDGKELRRVALRTCVGSCRAPPPAAFGWWGKGMRDNRTSTTKYNLVTFLPKALFEQYR